ncbi:MAG: HAD family phosphatase [Elusimicrobiota bacterium]|nr:MAG: HAD family phosphatase [Elusimicrobiota bacterium]
MAIKAVFFDIGNVLLKFSSKRILRKFAWAVGRHPVKVARHIWKENIVDRIERGEVTGEQIHRLFVDDLGYKGGFEDFRTLWCDQFTLDRGSFAILKSLSARVPTYLLSNTNALHIEHIKARYVFPGLVKGSILSHEHKLRKPQREIYEAALKLSGTAPEETVFIDDLEENCAGARAAGLHAIRYRGAKDLKKRLEALGL